MTLKFKISDYKKLIFKEFSFQILEKLLRIVCGFIIISKLSDFLGPEEYGSLLFIESNYILFLGISGFGLAPNIIKYLAQRKIRYKDYVFNALFISVLSSLVCFVSLNLWALSLNDFSYSKFFLPVSFLILFSPIYFIEYYYNSLNKIRVNVIIRLIAYLICFSLKILAINNESSFEVFIYILMLEAIIIYCLLIFSITGKLHLSNFQFDKIIFKKIFKNSLYVFLYSLGINLFYRIDILMIQKYLSLEDLGNYSASFRIISFGFVLPVIFAETFYPRILNTKGVVNQTIKKMYFISFWCSFLVFIFVYLFSDIIIDSFFSDKYVDVRHIFEISSFALLFIGISSTYSKVLYKHNLQQRMFFKILFGIALSISLNYFFIIKYGVYGVSYATIISIFILETLYDFFDNKLRKHHLVKLQSIFNFKLLK